jgi:molecular chaperone DnaK (HSP70)
MAVMIPAGARLPATGCTIFHTAVHNQDALLFSVFQGPWLMTKRNRLLASFVVSGIPRAEAGKEHVKVTFDVTIDGTLTATARIESRNTTTYLRATRTGHLLETSAVRQTPAEREAEKERDARENAEAARRIAIELLATNLEAFFRTQRPNDDNFRIMVPSSSRQELLKYVQSAIPQTSDPSLSYQTVASAFERVQTAIGPYMMCRQGDLPHWLNWEGI